MRGCSPPTQTHTRECEADTSAHTSTSHRMDSNTGADDMNHQEQNREALIRHIADLEAVIRRRNEQIDNQAHNARETQRAHEEIAHERDEARGALRARLGVLAEHRPLTPDDITDEMVRRGAQVATPAGVRYLRPHEVREILTAALTEPPTRPEEKVEAVLHQYWSGDINGDDLADRIVEEMNR